MNDPPRHWICTTSARSKFGNAEISGDAEIFRDAIVDRARKLSGDFDVRRITDLASDVAWGDFIWVYAKGDKILYALGRVADVQCATRPHTLKILWDVEATASLVDQPISWAEFEEGHPKRPAWSVNPATAAKLQAWLVAHGHHSGPFSGMADTENSEDLRKFVKAWVAYREGQQEFRQLLLDYYKKRCVVTGADVEDALDAAHISRYMGTHSNTLSNGLLLRLDVHRLFDRHLLGFDGSGKLVLHPSLIESKWAKKLGDVVLNPKARSVANPNYLRRHLEKVLSPGNEQPI